MALVTAAATPPIRPTIGRPPVGPTVTLKLPTATLAQVDLRAARQGLSRSQWLRAAVDAHLEAAQPATLRSLQKAGKLTGREVNCLTAYVEAGEVPLLVGPAAATSALTEALHQISGGEWIEIEGPDDVAGFLHHSARLATVNAASCREGVDLLAAYGIQSGVWSTPTAAAAAIFKKVDRVIALNDLGMIAHGTTLALDDTLAIRLPGAPDQSDPRTTLRGLLVGDTADLEAAIRSEKSLLVVGADVDQRGQLIEALVREVPWANHVAIVSTDLAATLQSTWRYHVHTVVIPTLPAEPALGETLTRCHSNGMQIIAGVLPDEAASMSKAAPFDHVVTLRDGGSGLHVLLSGGAG